MKSIKYLILISLSLWGFSSCNNDFEEVPIEQLTIDLVFSKTDSMGKNAKNFLNDIYAMMEDGHNRIGTGFFSAGDYLDTSTDDAISSSLTENDSYNLQVGRYTASSPIKADMKWGIYYDGIRKVNIFVNNIDVVPFKDTYNGGKPLNKAYKAEARFLRAYFYFEMVKRYGGIPLIGDHVFELGENLELARNSFEQCVDYIVGELDAIKNDLRTLPMENPSETAQVVTSEAAQAFKIRVLLYAASPLFNESPLEQNNSLIGYTSFDADRWEKAALAAKTFIDTYGDGKTFDLTKNFVDIFLGYYGKNTNPELIFFQQGSKGRNIENRNGPVGFSGDNTGLGQTSPTQNLVDAFLMADGKVIGDGKYQYSINNMYDHRDPRLAQTVLRNNAKWLRSELKTFDGGLSNPYGAIQKTKTSYYLRKFMGKFEDQEKYSDVLHLWVMFRYAEVLLNYAEAENEFAGPSNDVYNAIIRIRKRAGIEAGDDGKYGLKADMTKVEMRQIIQNERRIELAFEEHRYWDIRRWKIAEQVFSAPLRGLIIIKNPGSLEFNEVNVLKTSFDKRRYLYPIPYSEVIKNKNMVQNPQW